MKYTSIFLVLFLIFFAQISYSQSPTEGLDITNQQSDLKHNKVETITYTQYIFKNISKNESLKAGKLLSKEFYDISGNKTADIGYDGNGKILTQSLYFLLDSAVEVIKTESYINKDTIRTQDTVLLSNIIRHDTNILNNPDFKGFYRFTYDKNGLISQAIWYKRNGESSDIKDMTPLLLIKLTYT